MAMRVGRAMPPWAPSMTKPERRLCPANLPSKPAWAGPSPHDGGHRLPAERPTEGTRPKIGPSPMPAALSQSCREPILQSGRRLAQDRLIAAAVGDRSGLQRLATVQVVTKSAVLEAAQIGQRRIGDFAAAASAAGECEVGQGAIALPLERVVQVAAIARTSAASSAVFLAGRSPRLWAARRPLDSSVPTARSSHGLSCRDCWWPADNTATRCTRLAKASGPGFFFSPARINASSRSAGRSHCRPLSPARPTWSTTNCTTATDGTGG